jgi:hypothetical protein
MMAKTCQMKNKKKENRKAQIINLDIGIGDPVFPGPREMVILI